MSRLQELLKKLHPLEVNFPTAADEFTYFPKLPLELRLRIWKYAALEPRDIKLHLPIQRAINVSDSIQGQNPTPPLLCVSKESRAEVMKHYTVCYENSRTDEHGTFFCRKLYVKFDIDRFVQVCSCTIPPKSNKEHHWPNRARNFNVSRQVLKKIKYFAIDTTSYPCWGASWRFNAMSHIRLECAKLETFIMILGPKKIWGAETERILQPMTDEAVQREMVEFWIDWIRNCQKGYNWFRQIQMEYKTNGEVILRVKEAERESTRGFSSLILNAGEFLADNVGAVTST